MYWVVFSKCAESSLEATTEKSKECQDMKGEMYLLMTGKRTSSHLNAFFVFIPNM